MKNMYSLFSLILAFMLIYSYSWAQDEPLKIGLLPIKYREVAHGDPARQVFDMMYNEIVNGKRFVPLDRSFFQDLQNEKFLQSEIDFVDGSTIDKTRSEGAAYLLIGQVSTCRTERKVNENSTTYIAVLSIGLRVIDVETGQVKHSATLDYKPSSLPLIRLEYSTELEAIQRAISATKKDVLNFLDTYFPTRGEIREVSAYNKSRSRAENVVINLGRENGAVVGSRFEVSEYKLIDGELFFESIGEITITEINGNRLSTAKVNNGGDRIAALIAEGKKLVIRSKV